MPVKDCCRVVLCVRSGKGSERVHGPFRAMLASVPGFLLEDTVSQVSDEDGFPLASDSYSSKGGKIALTVCLAEASLIYIPST